MDYDTKALIVSIFIPLIGVATVFLFQLNHFTDSVRQFVRAYRRKNGERGDDITNDG